MTLMMVLTATSYKMAIAGKLPPVSYLTWLDKYTLSNYLLIIAVAVQSRALTQLGGDDEQTGLFDTVCTAVAAGFWGLMHAYYIQMAVKHYLQGGQLRDEYLRNREALSITKTYRKSKVTLRRNSVETASTRQSTREESADFARESGSI